MVVSLIGIETFFSKENFSILNPACGASHLLGKLIEWKQTNLVYNRKSEDKTSDFLYKNMFGSFGSIPIKNAVAHSSAHYYPVGEADVALGLPSLQVVSRKLIDIELEIVFFSEKNPLLVEWRKAARSRESALYVVRGEPQGNYVIVAISEEARQGYQGLSYRLKVTLKEEGAFLWKGNYSPYNPPPVARPAAEQGMKGLLEGLGGWLKR